MISRSKAMFLLLLTLVAGVAFSACSSSPATSDGQLKNTTIEKSGDTTLTGKLANKGGKYYLEQTGKQSQEVDTLSVDFASYTDKNVTITGQFSGDTLFVTKIE